MLLPRLAGGVVDIFLILTHGLRIFLQGDELVLLAGIEKNEILQLFFMSTVVVHQAVFQRPSKGIPELFILLPARPSASRASSARTFLSRFLAMVRSWAVVLQQLPGDIQAEILRVHNALDKGKVAGHSSSQFSMIMTPEE